MHDESAEGNEFFKCDFCRKPWAEDRPMVEGHQGSLVCASCLTVAYTELVVNGEASTIKHKCTMCLEERDQPEWRSPMFEDSLICLRCIKQAATTLEKDPECGWKRPGKD